MKNGLIFISVIFTLWTCGESKYRKSHATDAATSDSDSEIWGTYRGLYAYGSESSEFQNCQDNEIYWVQDRTGDLAERYMDLNPKDFQSVWIEVKGELLPPVKEGIASEYSKLLVVHEITTMAISNCQGEKVDEHQISERESPVTPDGRIQFLPGTTSTHIRGKVSGYETKEYILRALGGQTLTIGFKASNRFAYYSVRNENKMIFDSSTESVNESSILLPDTADYKIVVFLMRNEARREGKSEFTLDVEII